MTLTPSDHHIMRRARRAFTLLELVIVLGIILLLMGLVLGVGSIVLRQSEDRQVRATMSIVEAALLEFKQQAGRPIIFEGINSQNNSSINDPYFCGYSNCYGTPSYWDVPFRAIRDDRFRDEVSEGGFGWDFTQAPSPYGGSNNDYERQWMAATLSVLAQSPACAEILSKADPSLLRPVSTVTGNNGGEPITKTFNMKQFIDPWDKQVFIVFPGRRWFECDGNNPFRDPDGTIRTTQETAYGVCKNRRPLLISSGPDARIGVFDQSDERYDDDNDGIADHQDNLYSYAPEKP
jgi:prepilin-type N-terminal cleavage/methylation domain-containing protein